MGFFQFLTNWYRGSIIGDQIGLENPIDVRAFRAIEYLSQTLATSEEPFAILDLGCSGGPTNAWRESWSNYCWFGVDSNRSAIEKLKPILPKKSQVVAGCVFSEKFCEHPLQTEGPRLEIMELIASTKFDFVKIDVDGCDFHLLKGIFESAGGESILGVEIEVTYSSFRNSEINFDRCAAYLLSRGFEPVAIESVRRYASSSLPSPFTWDIRAQSAMGVVFQGNQVWVRKKLGANSRSRIATSLILAAYGLSDWSWQVLEESIDEGVFSSFDQSMLAKKHLFIPSFLGRITVEQYQKELANAFKYQGKFKNWRRQSRFREIEQPWFLSN